MPYAKNHIRVTVPKRSGFDKSFRNSGTGTCGTLIPLLCDEVVPNTRVHLRVPIAAQMPPLASETYMNVKLKLEAFFVPMRLLCGSFESFFTDFPKRVTAGPSAGASPEAFADVKGLLPCILFKHAQQAGAQTIDLGRGSLADYLGFSSPAFQTTLSGVPMNLMPFLAYHKVWEDYYRNPRVQNPAFAPSLRIQGVDTPLRIASCPFDFLHDNFSIYGGNQVQNYFLVCTVNPLEDARFKLADGTNLFALRQRNFGLDYFTGARVDAQQGAAVTVSVPASGGDANRFSVASLRAANSLQQFRERNNLPSPRLIDQVKARYGAILSDGVAQRPICIGSATMDMYTHGVDQTADAIQGSSESVGSRNPFSSVAAQYGRASVSGNELLIENFTANEPGYILVLMSQVPEVSYSYGVNPVFGRYTQPGSIVQMANPLLQNMGDQPVYVHEVSGYNPVSQDSPYVFGYQDRFSDFMFIKNQIHGEFRADGSLSSFVAQRTIGQNVELSSAFLEIPKNYLNDVLATDESVSKLTYWFDSYLDYKISMPLAEFSIPSLQDPAYEHGESVSLRRNGQIF